MTPRPQRAVPPGASYLLLVVLVVVCVALFRATLDDERRRPMPGQPAPELPLTRRAFNPHGLGLADQIGALRQDLDDLSRDTPAPTPRAHAPTNDRDAASPGRGSARTDTRAGLLETLRSALGLE